MPPKETKWFSVIKMVLILLVLLPFMLSTAFKPKSLKFTQKENGLYGYISFDREPILKEYGAGIGFYVASGPAF